MWNEQQTNIINNNQGDSDGEVDDDLEHHSVLSRDSAAVETENGGDRVHNIQRLERALRTAGMA